MHFQVWKFLKVDWMEIEFQSNLIEFEMEYE